MNELRPDDRKTYSGCNIFQNECKIKPEGGCEPVIVWREGETFTLSEEEKDFLSLSPKYCILKNLSDERFEIEVEQAIVKYKWELMGEEIEKSKREKRRSLADEAIDTLFTDEELLKIEEDIEEGVRIKEAESRMIFDYKKKSFNYSRRKATDQKSNARVILPRKTTAETEGKLELFRLEIREAFDNFLAANCEEGGAQKKNLTSSQQRGLKSILNRVKKGELAIIPTDKTGKFAVMSMSTYIECGLSHTTKDTEVGWAELKLAQNEINGHVSMLAKIFKIGKMWDQQDRVRETMLGGSLTTCPVGLLYKDHKGWTPAKGGVPPTRHVVGGHVGINMHLSEIVSDIIESCVEYIPGGCEVISTEDFLAQVEDVNTENEGWYSGSWWDGWVEGGFIVCGKCFGKPSYNFDEDSPEWCYCDQGGVLEVGCDESKEISNKNITEGDGVSTGKIERTNINKKIVKKKVTIQFMKKRRRSIWEKMHGWKNSDIDRKIKSTDALPEDIQDYMVPMVCVGTDAINLYPSLDVDKVCQEVLLGIRQADIKWEEIDYIEATRYICLNWSAEECRKSCLSRVLPRRRGKKGTIPGVRGAGPRGPTRGDQEQWEFPTVKLEEWERNEILAVVVSIAVKAMFKKHYYSFNGRTYHQNNGGPIGVRGTCAVARLCMQIFDQKWSRKLMEVCIRVRKNMRYMDDGRTLLQPIRPGWRWVGEELLFCTRWEREGRDKTPECISKQVLLHSLNGVTDYLRFTVESQEDFQGWLPTLDTNIRVENDNTILFKFYKKPESAKNVVHQSTAMEENSKMKILANDVMRRMKNTCERMGPGEKRRIIDDYAQELCNSGYSIDQVRRVLISGIKGFESKRRRCQELGERLRRTGKMSKNTRVMKKLTAKSSWFKGNKDKKPEYDGRQKGKTKKMKNLSCDQGRVKTKTIIFVEQTEMGKLAKALREVMERIAPILGFNAKIVERTGVSLKNLVQPRVEEGTICGREDCIPCNQGGDHHPPCTRRGAVYENICAVCNKGAGDKRDPKELETTTPTVYVGETSRSIKERVGQHWADYAGRETKSHILKHQLLTHQGEEPEFIVRAVSFHKTALDRQVSEAVRIRRIGGEGRVLNSKAEFNRSYIPRLVVEERDDINLDVPEASRALLDAIETEDENWECRKTLERKYENMKYMKEERDRSKYKKKRQVGEEPQKIVKKKRKYQLMEEDWGESTLHSHSNLKVGDISSTPTTEPAATITNTQVEHNQERRTKTILTTGSRVGREVTGTMWDYVNRLQTSCLDSRPPPILTGNVLELDEVPEVELHEKVPELIAGYDVEQVELEEIPELGAGYDETPAYTEQVELVEVESEETSELVAVYDETPACVEQVELNEVSEVVAGYDVVQAYVEQVELYEVPKVVARSDEVPAYVKQMELEEAPELVAGYDKVPAYVEQVELGKVSELVARYDETPAYDEQVEFDKVPELVAGEDKPPALDEHVQSNEVSEFVAGYDKAPAYVEQEELNEVPRLVARYDEAPTFDELVESEEVSELVAGDDKAPAYVEQEELNEVPMLVAGYDEAPAHVEQQQLGDHQHQQDYIGETQVLDSFTNLKAAMIGEETAADPENVSRVLKVPDKSVTNQQTRDSNSGNAKCTFDRNGVCHIHKLMGKKLLVSTINRRGGGRGAGRKSGNPTLSKPKIEKFICAVSAAGAVKNSRIANWLNTHSQPISGGGEQLKYSTGIWASNGEGFRVGDEDSTNQNIVVKLLPNVRRMGGLEEVHEDDV